jgi:hypothetical protein
VISPPNSDTEFTSAAAVAEAFVPACADALAFAEPLVTIGLPSGPVPKLKLPLN